MLSQYTVAPSSPTLSPAQLRSALAFAEAILPGSPTTPGADETTVARLEEVMRAVSPHVVTGWSSALALLDQAVRLQKGKPFHALTRSEQESVLHAWEKSPILRGPLHALAYIFKIAHFDSPRTYESMGGTLKVVQNVETYRWEQQIQSARGWTGDRDVECEVVVIGTGAGGAVVGRELADRGFAVVYIEEGSYRKRSDFLGSFIHAHTNYFRNTFTLGSSPITLLMGKLVGGSTAVNTGTSLRPPTWVLDEWSERLDTDDFSPSAMSPYFDRVERILQVSPPERKFIGPIADVVDRGCKTFGWSARPIPRNAVGCEGQGFCDYGCAQGARRSVDISYLPGALEKGAMIITDLRADHIMIEHGLVERRLKLFAVRRRARAQPHQQVVAQGFAEQPWHLRCVGHLWRRHEGCQVVEPAVVPAHFAGLRRQQPKQRPQQGAFAAADTPSDDHELPALDAQIDPLDTAIAAGVAIGQPRDRQCSER